MSLVWSLQTTDIQPGLAFFMYHSEFRGGMDRERKRILPSLIPQNIKMWHRRSGCDSTVPYF